MKTGADIIEYLHEYKGKVKSISRDFDIQVYDGLTNQGAIHHGEVAIIKMEERSSGVLSIFLQNPDDVCDIYYNKEVKLGALDNITKVFKEFEDHVNIENVMAALFLLKW